MRSAALRRRSGRGHSAQRAGCRRRSLWGAEPRCWRSPCRRPRGKQELLIEILEGRVVNPDDHQVLGHGLRTANREAGVDRTSLERLQKARSIAQDPERRRADGDQRQQQTRRFRLLPMPKRFIQPSPLRYSPIRPTHPPPLAARRANLSGAVYAQSDGRTRPRVDGRWGTGLGCRVVTRMRRAQRATMWAVVGLGLAAAGCGGSSAPKPTRVADTTGAPAAKAVAQPPTPCSPRPCAWRRSVAPS